MATFLESDRLALRGVTLSDANAKYQKWINDREVVRYLESRHFPHSIESLREFISSLANDRSNLFLAIDTKPERKHIGNIKLGPIDWIHRVADIGIMIGEGDCHGKGLGFEALTLVRDYAFQHLNLHKLTAGMYAPNVSSQKIFAKAGFIVEGVRKSHYFCEGEYVDGILMGMINPREAATTE